MDSIGTRIRTERERLGLSQSALGKIGGIKPNAQGKYESSERFPRADYLSALAANGVDVAYLITGIKTAPAEISATEYSMLGNFRILKSADQIAIHQIITSLSEYSKTNRK